MSKLLAELTCKRYSDGFGIRTICLRINNNWYLERASAEVAVSSGWAQQFDVEDLWTARYRKTVEDAEGDWPTPGPPAPHKILWAFTDARDAAQAFRLAVENDTIKPTRSFSSTVTTPAQGSRPPNSSPATIPAYPSKRRSKAMPRSGRMKGRPDCWATGPNTPGAEATSTPGWSNNNDRKKD